MTTPHYETIIQCIDVVKGLPIDQWESQKPSVRRSADLVGRWTIEKALLAAISHRGVQVPPGTSLIELYKASGVQMNHESEALLEVVDRDVSASQPLEEDEITLYRDSCLLARGVVETVHQHLTLADVRRRGNAGNP